VHRTRFGRFLRPAGVPWSRRTSNTPAELRLLPTQRPVREGIYEQHTAPRKSLSTRKIARSGKSATPLPRPPRHSPRQRPRSACRRQSLNSGPPRPGPRRGAEASPASIRFGARRATSAPSLGRRKPRRMAGRARGARPGRPETSPPRRRRVPAGPAPSRTPQRGRTRTAPLARAGAPPWRLDSSPAPAALRKRNDRTPAVSSTLPAYHCLERLLYPCGASTYFGWRSVQGGSYGTLPGRCKWPEQRKAARSGKSAAGAFDSHLRAILGSPWSGVRAAEGARLEIVWAGLTRLEGSNPSHSVARWLEAGSRAGWRRVSASISRAFPGV
jgi:hypothetical protein